MTPDERLHKAISRITRARASIIRTAAAWQAHGTETSALSEPLVEMQEALAQLELLAGSTTAAVAAPSFAEAADAHADACSDT